MGWEKVGSLRPPNAGGPARHPTTYRRGTFSGRFCLDDLISEGLEHQT